jgi:FkbM family methyltransferase
VAKYIGGVWLPDREEHLIPMIEAGPYFAGAKTFQFRKFAAAFPHIKNFRHAVDVGAHCGLWTRVLARCFSIVTAFEPNPELEDCFWMNNPWRKMDERSQIVHKPVGLGHRAEKLKLNTQLPHSTAFTRIDPEGDTEIEIRTLDSFNLEWVDFIKIDVEGWEANVVRGAETTIRTWQPTLIVEQKPGNAERQGMKQYEAADLLRSWGARPIADISGDVILAF